MFPLANHTTHCRKSNTVGQIFRYATTVGPIRGTQARPPRPPVRPRPHPPFPAPRLAPSPPQTLSPGRRRRQPRFASSIIRASRARCCAARRTGPRTKILHTPRTRCDLPRRHPRRVDRIRTLCISWRHYFRPGTAGRCMSEFDAEGCQRHDNCTGNPMQCDISAPPACVRFPCLICGSTPQKGWKVLKILQVYNRTLSMHASCQLMGRHLGSH
jgi:hypothetical protein